MKRLIIATRFAARPILASHFLIRRIALILGAKPIAVVIDRKLRSRGCGIACSLYLTHLQSAITICFVIGGG
jgi:hypothetical protein